MDEYDAPFLEDDDDDEEKWWDAFEDFFTEYLFDDDDLWRNKHENIMDDLHAELTKPTSKIAKSRAVSYILPTWTYVNSYCSS